MCAAALFRGGGLSVAQEQGPLHRFQHHRRQAAQADADSDTKPGDDSDLPKIPSEYTEGQARYHNLPTFKTDVDIVTLDVSVLDNKGHFIPGIPATNFRVLEDNVPQQIQSINGRSAHDGGHGGRVQQPLPAALLP